MTEIRFLLDENVDPVLRTELLRRNPAIIVWRVGDPGAPSEGTLDPEILRWCERNFFFLVTHNRKSMPRHLKDHLAEERHVPGIIELHPGMRIGEAIEELNLIWELADPAEYTDSILYLPLT